MDIVFVTSNGNKVPSAQKYFIGTDINLKWYKDNLNEPTVNDIELIARAKVIEAYGIVHEPCIVLDSGFYINNYPNQPGFPGAFPKREIIEKADMGIEGLLKNMEGVTDRNCYFKDCLAYYDGKEISFFYGISKGTLATSISKSYCDKNWSKLWYVFIPKNHKHTLAEMTDEERNNRLDGHTSAFKEFADYCKVKK